MTSYTQTLNPSLEEELSPFSFLRPELDRVETLIREQATKFDPAVEPYISYILNTSGKRIRPALTFLSGGATGELSDDHHKLAVILELIHVATLVHDDIIDGAEIRRQAPTANAKWGDGLSVLLGDCLFAHALMLSSQLGDKVISEKVASAANDVCSGEIIQTQRRFDLQLSKSDYFDIIQKKTAALFAAAMELGARLNQQPAGICEALHQFGLHIGTAYQIYDDCIDLVGDEKEFGKTLRTDLNKGKLTLPILNLLGSASERQREKLHRLLIQKEPLDVSTLASIADYAGSIEAAIDTGQELVTEARECLTVLDESDHKEALLGIADFLDVLLGGCRQ
ncbi:MAG: farnesyltranstransferase [Verrucomicrobiales bacterium]|mgnify:FL=1|nr:farnesyltranstransferase [Verrucomicrobiales bacterium]|tara:strand:+ start:8007 stop:9023 length:1017 start_codon:yes stop_codon:yes gene_type:complete